MTIKSLNLVSFGRFKNKQIELSDGLNIIYGKNESGKSTIMSFIKAMLYGVSGRGVLSERKRWYPWDADVMEGEMEAEHEGRLYRIYRKWGRTAAGDRYSLFDGVTGESVDFDINNMVGAGEEAFLKTLYIRQSTACIEGEDDEISNKLINLIHSGDENQNYHKAVDILKNAAKKFKPQRGNGGRIFELQSKITMLNQELENAKELNLKTIKDAARQRELISKIAESRVKISVLKQKLEKAREYADYKKMYALKKRVNDLKAAKENAADEGKKLGEMVSSLSAFSREADSIIYEKPADASQTAERLMKSRNTAALYKRLFAAALTAAGISLVLCFLSLILIPVCLLFIALAVFLKSGGRKLEVSINEMEAEINNAKKMREKIELELKAFGCKDLREYTEKRAEYTGILQKHKAARERLLVIEAELESAEAELGPNTEVLGEELPLPAEEMDALALEKELADENERLTNLLREEAEISGRLKASVDKDRTADVIESERQEALEELKDAVEKHTALTIAMETLEAAYAEISRDFTPAINERASKIIEKITDGVRRSMKIDKKYGVKLEDGGLRDITCFSYGTTEQAYLAVRLSLIDLIFGDNSPPIFIDDSFVHYDEDRLKNVLSLLLERSKRGQIILFSCRDLGVVEGANICRLSK